MSGDLGQFFSLIGKAKKEKEDEFRSLVGEVDIDSMFSQVKDSIKEDKQKKKKEEKQIQALESWLFAEAQLQEKTEEVTKSPAIGVDETEYEKWIEDDWDEEEEVTSEVVEETEEEEVEDTVDHALKILETIKSKEEVRENLEDPEILKIRRELEYLKNLVNAQGGGGEVRLEFLDDVDRDSVKVDGKFLKYQASTGKFIGADSSGGSTGAGGTWATFSSNTGITTTKKVKIDNDLEITGVTTSTGGFVGTLTGSASSLSGVSSSFLLDYNNFTNTPTIPTNNNQLTNGAGFITASDNITGTAAGLSGSPDIGVQNIVGVAATFTGDLTIEGTLSYEDITNIDSVGFATFRKGIEVQGAGSTTTTLNVTGVSTLGIVTSSSIFSTGIITATTFAGALTGDVTGDVNAGIVTSSTVVLTNGLITTVSSTTTATDQTSIDSFSASTHRSAKYNVQITRGSEYQTTEISVVHDGSDSYGTEYATIKTGATLATFSTDISGGNVRLLATPSSATSTVFKLFRTATEV